MSYTFHLGPTDYTTFLRPMGALGMLVLYVDFAEAPATEPTEPLFTALAPATAQWYAGASNGRLTLPPSYVQIWLRMPKAASAYDLDFRGNYPDILARHRAYLADAVALADPVVDFRQFSLVVIVPSNGAPISHALGYALSAGTGVMADGTELRGAVTLSSDTRTRAPILVHEAAHAFGLPDLYDFSVPYQEGTRHLGRWDPMSRAGSLAQFLEWQKWKLGWLEPQGLRCLTAPGTLEETLTPLETAGGVRAVVLPTGPTTAHVVEVHTLLGTSDEQCDRGVLVYTVDVARRSGEAAARIKPAQGDATEHPSCGPLQRAAFDLGAGEISTFEDDVMRLELLATDGSAYRVRVTRK